MAKKYGSPMVMYHYVANNRLLDFSFLFYGVAFIILPPARFTCALHYFCESFLGQMEQGKMRRIRIILVLVSSSILLFLSLNEVMHYSSTNAILSKQKPKYFILFLYFCWVFCVRRNTQEC